MNEEIKTATEEAVSAEAPVETEAAPEAEVRTEAKAAPEVEVPTEAEAAPETVEEPAPSTEPETTLTPDEVNAANAERSTGKVDDDGMGAAFFTAADVRAMSREQVRRNLPKILKSMESDKF